MTHSRGFHPSTRQPVSHGAKAPDPSLTLLTPHVSWTSYKRWVSGCLPSRCVTQQTCQSLPQTFALAPLEKQSSCAPISTIDETAVTCPTWPEPILPQLQSPREIEVGLEESLWINRITQVCKNIYGILKNTARKEVGVEDAEECQSSIRLCCELFWAKTCSVCPLT